MRIAEVIATLASGGVIVSRWQIYAAIRAGYVPRPALTSSLEFDFAKSDMAALRRHFKQPRARGRKPAVAAK